MGQKYFSSQWSLLSMIKLFECKYGLIFTGGPFQKHLRQDDFRFNTSIQGEYMVKLYPLKYI